MPSELDSQEMCHVTTTGRVTGTPHTIEIWFAHDAGTIYLLSGGGARSDWVRNIVREPEVSVEAGGMVTPGRARIVEDAEEAQRARDLVFDKYQPGYRGDLTRWRDTSLPVAVDLEDPATPSSRGAT